MVKEEDILREPQRTSPSGSPQRSDSVAPFWRGFQLATELWRVDSTAFGRKARTTGEARLQLLLGIVLLLLAVVLLVTILLEDGDGSSQSSAAMFQVIERTKTLEGPFHHCIVIITVRSHKKTMLALGERRSARVILCKVLFVSLAGDHQRGQTTCLRS